MSDHAKLYKFRKDLNKKEKYMARYSGLTHIGFWLDKKPKLDPENYGEINEDGIHRSWPIENVEWNDFERDVVLDTLSKGSSGASYKGSSSCRICGKRLGTCDVFNDQYVWPDKYDHYITEHGIKPPDHFIDHCFKEINHKLYSLMHWVKWPNLPNLPGFTIHTIPGDKKIIEINSMKELNRLNKSFDVMIVENAKNMTGRVKNVIFIDDKGKMFKGR